MSDIRLDKYLWAVRIFKTRSDAADAIRQNRVMVNNAYAKPSREVKVGAARNHIFLFEPFQKNGSNVDLNFFRNILIFNRLSLFLALFHIYL